MSAINGLVVAAEEGGVFLEASEVTRMGGAIVDFKGSGCGFGPCCAACHHRPLIFLQNGRFHAMRTTIDPAGRLVIPKRIRDRLGLRGNEQVEITERDGRIEIEPAPTEVELVREGSVLVARPDRALPPLTDDIVRETLDRVRR